MLKLHGNNFIMFWRNSRTCSTSSFLVYLYIIIASICLCGIPLSYSQDISRNETLVRLLDPRGEHIDKNLVSVEISVGRRAYYKICESTHDNFKIGSIVCRQLDLGPPVIVQSSYTIFQGYRFQPGSCNGTETSLSSCSFTLDTGSLCSHIKIQCLPTVSSDLDVALVLSDQFSEIGIPLVYYDGVWSPVCYGDLKNAVCNQLGLGDENSWSNRPRYIEVFDTTQRYISINCPTAAVSIAECERKISTCCGCSSYLWTSCRGRGSYNYNNDIDEDNNDYGDPSISGRLIGFFLVIIGAVIIMSVRCWIIQSRGASQNQTNGRPVAVSSSVPASNVNYPRQTTVPSNAGSSLSAAQTSFATEYNTLASYVTAFPPSYSAGNSQAYVSGIIKDPNLPTYQEALRHDPS